MAERCFYKTVVSFTVLSEEPIPDGTRLEDIIHETAEGRYVGCYSRTLEKRVNGAEMVEELREAGSCPDFFELDDEGNDVDPDEAYFRALNAECLGCDDEECAAFDPKYADASNAIRQLSLPLDKK